MRLSKDVTLTDELLQNVSQKMTEMMDRDRKQTAKQSNAEFIFSKHFRFVYILDMMSITGCYCVKPTATVKYTTLLAQSVGNYNTLDPSF